MLWNWELADWPNFKYHSDDILQKEKQFLFEVGKAAAFLKSIEKADYSQFVIEILSTEGLESSRIEGEYLERESLQSSIKQHFKLSPPNKENKKEQGMAQILCNVYETFSKPLTEKMLCEWHETLFTDRSNLEERGRYRSHPEAMQIVSSRQGNTKVFFEAPPSIKINAEMDRFIKWFNSPLKNESILGRAAICHVYFESIHPFEDGNGRIGRLLVEKILSQELKSPTLIAVSKTLEKRKKEYYAALERCNRTLDVNHWVNFFAEVILQAQAESINLLYFLIEKSKMLHRLSGQLNERQEKVLLRIFSEGLNGFKGGLSAENYITISKTSRATTTRDLNDLVQKAALIKTGELRHTRYWLNINHQS